MAYTESYHASSKPDAIGKFHALPVFGHAMYAPEIRCNGAEMRIQVEERME